MNGRPGRGSGWLGDSMNIENALILRLDHPAHDAPAAKDVHMKMRYFLMRVLAIVGDQTVAAVFHANHFGGLGDGLHERAHFLD